MADHSVQALAALIDRTEGGRAEVARRIHANEQTLYQITRGIPLESGKPRTVGRSLRERLDREFPGWLDAPLHRAPQTSIAHQGRQLGSGEPPPVSLYVRTVPAEITWEDLMHRTAAELPSEFRTNSPDDALAPRLRAGQVVTLQRDLQPRAGDGVLVLDRTGGRHLRIYRPAVGRWEAHALGADWPVMDSLRDGLTVLAVLTAVESRWG